MSDDLNRLLIIGNSHIAAPRLAYVAAPERWPGWDVDFLGLPRGQFGRLELRDGSLAARDEGVARNMRKYNFVSHLDVTGYDAFATVGGFGWSGTAGFVDDHRGIDFPSVLGGEDDCQLVGAAFLSHALRTLLRGMAAVRLADQLKGLKKPIVMVPEPLPSADCKDAPEQYGAYCRMVDRGDGGFWRDWFLRIADELLGDHAHLRMWPKTAVVDGLYTDPVMMRGAPVLSPHKDEEQPDTDFAHGNADYGALVMDQIVAELPGG